MPTSRNAFLFYLKPLMKVCRSVSTFEPTS
nr:MAG TPA: hypothetical protein [Caudoviricetes sp.]